MTPDFSPGILVSSALSQALVTFAYKHPEIKWLNKENVRLVSIICSSVLAILTAYASGDLSQDLVQNAITAAWDAFVGSSMSVALYEWTKDGWNKALKKIFPHWGI